MVSTSDHVDRARTVLGATLALPPTLGNGWLICVDGPAGSGKTTLAAAIRAIGGSGPDRIQVVHTDDLLHGWAGLPGLAESVRHLVAPLSQGKPGLWRRWDWHASDWAETCRVEPGGLLILEGVGSWSPAIASRVTTLVWMEADNNLRLARSLARDGDDFAPYWEQWAAAEKELFARDGTRSHADLVLRT